MDNWFLIAAGIVGWIGFFILFAAVWAGYWKLLLEEVTDRPSDGVNVVMSVVGIFIMSAVLLVMLWLAVAALGG